MSDPAPPGLADGPVYLDYNATTPIDPRVLDALLPYLRTDFGNPSSSHAYGGAPHAALDTARTRVADLLGARPGEIVFTGSGSESNLLALQGVMVRGQRAHLIAQVTEHPSVLQTCRALERLHGVRVTLLPVSSDGHVDPDALAAAIGDDTALVSIMVANNETGVLQPIQELAAIAHRHGALFHCDAAQAAGKIALDVDTLGVDLLTVVGHKIYAPKGIAALYVRTGVELEPVVHGGGQEHGLRAGTENVAFAVALGAAAELAAADLTDGTVHRIARLRDELHRKLTEALPCRLHLNGAAEARLPNTLNISIDGCLGHEMLAAASEIAASTGSACHSGTHTPSPVLTAMGIPEQRAMATVRLSLGRWTTLRDIETATAALTKVVAT
ncbi:cysteine desulfurase family protein [Nocardia xishanensis]|uniref:Cysteine desulfurase family protein n=1 Tax=Nocardia xishanensis TaxID=238964 RepID=A0ABW7X7V6_9NOCA